MYDYAGLLREVIMPEIEEDVFTRPLAQLQAIATEDTNIKQGHTIAKDIRVTHTSPARNTTQADVDPVAGSGATVKAYWTKLYQDTAIEVHGQEISESGGEGPNIRNLLADATKAEMPHLLQLIFDDIYAQWKLDLLASGTYSDAALNRTTYPVLAPYNEVTNTACTVALVRNMMYGTRLNKAAPPKSAYQIVLEPAVEHVLYPQVGLLTTWQQQQGAAGYAGGYSDLAKFEGSPVVSVQGMTTGDVFYAPKAFLRWQNHRKLTYENVYAGRDAIKIIVRCGFNGWVENVGKCGMMTVKD